mmetsp:Transcript_179544/g.436847  ORF Transcript_179544/g.436847 Transcript_179544/m.436847 type:complete len:956 (-) Transcript_179544:571-3438(-)
MASDWDPVIDGIRPGCLVEVYDLSEKELRPFGGADVNGQLGQVEHYAGGDLNRFYVTLVNGVAAYFEPKNVRLVSGITQSGDGENGFDILMAPKTSAAVLGNEIATCILEKGYCMIKICQDARAIEPTVERLRAMGTEGGLARLPEEVEEHYLGNGCRGKVTWLDYDNKELAGDVILTGNDANLSYIAQVFQSYSGDILSDWVDERSASLVCLSLTDDEEPDFPYPEADDVVLGDFLQTHRRSLLRMVHFMGPGTASVVLDPKDSEKAAKTAKPPTTTSLTAAPNTILLFRPDAYDLTCDAPDETLMLLSHLLSPVPQMYLRSLEGDTSWLNKTGQGPPPPLGDQTYVINNVSRFPAFMDEEWSMFSCYKGACDCVVECPFVRWDVHTYWTSDDANFQPWQSTTRHQSLVEGIEFFDNRHFEISNAEAGGMDPVQRLLLETGAQSLAMVGITKKMANRKSMHAGFAVGNDKLDWAYIPKDTTVSSSMAGTGQAVSIIANRFNFVYNMKGPSFVCDTACSASLSSTHAVRLMMLQPQYDPLEFFITMGAQLVLAMSQFVGCSQSHMSSPKGRCFTFNNSADGYLRGEGISGYMIKYGKFMDDSDAILRSTMSGQDGRSASLTAPNGPAQEELISRAIKMAHMTPPESSVWECHGTGTSLGDPIEIGAVRKVQIRMPRTEPLMLSSNKTNIGHLEGGAAMGGQVKCIIQCKHARCCPTLHLRTLNPHLEHSQFDAIMETEAACYHYPQGHSQVSSFGFGGTNGHGIFWGQNFSNQPDVYTLWTRRVESRKAPEVRAVGGDPDDWEADFPDVRYLKEGTKYKIELSPDDPEEQALKWELQDEEDADRDEDGDFYAITGNFNEWSDDRMAAGDVDGVHIAFVEVPEGGELQFRFLKNGDTEKVLGPATPECMQKTEAIVGPKKDITNSWVVQAEEQQEFRVELFVRAGVRSVMWRAERS